MAYQALLPQGLPELTYLDLKTLNHLMQVRFFLLKGCETRLFIRS